MLLTDYFRYPQDATWDLAKQCGVTHGVIRLPETDDFDLTDASHWQTVVDGFLAQGIRPVIIEPMPNALHDHIKAGDDKRDECIDKVIQMFPIMRQQGIDTICFNWMAHIGWLRTRSDIEERGGAKVTGFDMKDFAGSEIGITKDQLWGNYEYFLRAVMPHAEKYGIKLALHPDDPPRDLGKVHRIMTSKESVRRALYEIYPSENLGLTMCQANFYIMGEDVEDCIRTFADKIFFVHFRNTVGNKERFRETFHDNGALDMAGLIRLYKELKIDVPVRVDHVPTLKGEDTEVAGYAALGRLFAIGYLKGLLEG